MRAAERFAKRHVPVESHPQMASAAESRMSRTRRSLFAQSVVPAATIPGCLQKGACLIPAAGKEETPDGAAFTVL